jgi:hypothetical protein
MDYQREPRQRLDSKRFSSGYRRSLRLERATVRIALISLDRSPGSGVAPTSGEALSENKEQELDRLTL